MRMLRFAAIAAACWSAIHAQEKAQIAAVAGAAYGGIGVAAGGLGTIYGTNLSSGTFSASSTPWPVKLGDTEVWLCGNPLFIERCIPAGLTYAGPTQINFYVPESASGMSNVFVRRNGFPNTSPVAWAQASLIAIQDIAPQAFWMGWDCFIDTRYEEANQNCGLSVKKPPTLASTRGAISDLQGRVISSSNPARPGQYYSLWMTGLGKFSNGKPVRPFSLSLREVPIHGSAFTTTVTVTPSYIGPSAQFPGLYQVNFQLPTKAVDGAGNLPEANQPYACGSYNWELTVWMEQDTGFGRQFANPLNLPVSVKNGDIPNCAK